MFFNLFGGSGSAEHDAPPENIQAEGEANEGASDVSGAEDGLEAALAAGPIAAVDGAVAAVDTDHVVADEDDGFVLFAGDGDGDGADGAAAAAAAGSYRGMPSKGGYGSMSMGGKMGSMSMGGKMMGGRGSMSMGSKFGSKGGKWSGSMGSKGSMRMSKGGKMSRGSMRNYEREGPCFGMSVMTCLIVTGVGSLVLVVGILCLWTFVLKPVQICVTQETVVHKTACCGPTGTVDAGVMDNVKGLVESGGALIENAVSDIAGGRGSIYHSFSTLAGCVGEAQKAGIPYVNYFDPQYSPNMNCHLYKTEECKVVNCKSVDGSYFQMNKGIAASKATYDEISNICAGALLVAVPIGGASSAAVPTMDGKSLSLSQVAR
ncbi:unnamed protein product [Amoebophrya sp. A120]|nr:unnamed protein product [Amoebophrya sp. A120]|eukprot:GSA120T00001964001.1